MPYEQILWQVWNAIIEALPFATAIFFAIITFIRLFYFGFFYSRLAFYKPQVQLTHQQMPVSIIICARDEAINLSKNLPIILNQHYGASHEVIVVNDNSLDDSFYVLQDFEKQYKNLKVIHLTQEAIGIKGKKYPLSIGIKSARYETLLLTDADCKPNSNSWLQEMQHSFIPQKQIVLGYAPYLKHKGFVNLLVRWEAYLTALQYLSYTLAGKPYMGVGRNLSYVRTLFIKNKGFSAHNQIASGDDDLFISAVANKKNTAININKETFAYSEAPKTFAQWKVQKARHFSTFSYYKAFTKFLLGIFTLSQFLFIPAAILSIIFFNPIISGAVFLALLLIEFTIHFMVMKKLDVKDLGKHLTWLYLWQMLYYILFLPSLHKKRNNRWK